MSTNLPLGLIMSPLASPIRVFTGVSGGCLNELYKQDKNTFPDAPELIKRPP